MEPAPTASKLESPPSPPSRASMPPPPPSSRASMSLPSPPDPTAPTDPVAPPDPEAPPSPDLDPPTPPLPTVWPGTMPGVVELSPPHATNASARHAPSATFDKPKRKNPVFACLSSEDSNETKLRRDAIFCHAKDRFSTSIGLGAQSAGRCRPTIVETPRRLFDIQEGERAARQKPLGSI